MVGQEWDACDMVTETGCILAAHVSTPVITTVCRVLVTQGL